MNTRFKVFASYTIFQYLSDFIHVLIFVNVSKCQKSPKLTNIVMWYDLGYDIALFTYLFNTNYTSLDISTSIISRCINEISLRDVV